MAKSNAEKRSLADIGASVRRARVARQVTQERLAELTGLNARMVQKIEAGDINFLVTTLGKIQAALRCDWTELLGPEMLAPPVGGSRGLALVLVEAAGEVRQLRDVHATRQSNMAALHIESDVP